MWTEVQRVFPWSEVVQADRVVCPGVCVCSIPLCHVGREVRHREHPREERYRTGGHLLSDQHHLVEAQRGPQVHPRTDIRLRHARVRCPHHVQDPLGQVQRQVGHPRREQSGTFLPGLCLSHPTVPSRSSSFTRQTPEPENRVKTWVNDTLKLVQWREEII